MNLVPNLPSHAAATIGAFLRHHAGAAGGGGVVVGLSGGIDSALSARLARDALGPSRVLGVLLPDRRFPESLRAETEAYAASLGIRCRVLPIDPVERSIAALLPEVTDRVARGNVQARVRMLLLYSIAREEHSLVLGTGNKSEILLGYFTKFGDGGADILPLGDLYKTQVRALARELELPQAILERAPTAGLWEGQTDEGELGLGYAELDQVLFGVEQLRTPEEIAAGSGLALPVVESLVSRIEGNRHKRRSPPIPKIGLRTIGIDWRD
ncbi:MAG: NAD+ synthase [Thermoplasmata archaeon]|nr:NAD+ synthase [Thermoplasmata archaeon]